MRPNALLSKHKTYLCLANYNFASIWGFLFSLWDIVLDKLSLCQYFSRSAYYKEIADPLWMEKARSMEENIFKSEFYHFLNKIE